MLSAKCSAFSAVLPCVADFSAVANNGAERGVVRRPATEKGGIRRRFVTHQTVERQKLVKKLKRHVLQFTFISLSTLFGFYLLVVVVVVELIF